MTGLSSLKEQGFVDLDLFCIQLNKDVNSIRVKKTDFDSFNIQLQDAVKEAFQEYFKVIGSSSVLGNPQIFTDIRSEERLLSFSGTHLGKLMLKIKIH